MENILENNWMIAGIIILAIFDFTMKFIAMWKASRNNHKTWYILLAVLNTIGILPIIYLNRNKTK
jgi:hypothetical protein